MADWTLREVDGTGTVASFYDLVPNRDLPYFQHEGISVTIDQRMGSNTPRDYPPYYMFAGATRPDRSRDQMFVRLPFDRLEAATEAAERFIEAARVFVYGDRPAAYAVLAGWQVGRVAYAEEQAATTADPATRVCRESALERERHRFDQYRALAMSGAGSSMVGPVGNET